MKNNITRLIDLLNKVIITILLLLSAVNIISSFLMFHGIKNPVLLHYFLIHHTIRRLLSFIILIVAWNLYKRLSMAWTITMAALSVVIFQQLLISRHNGFHIILLAEITVFFVLLFSKNYYCRKADRYSLKRSILIYLLCNAFIFLNAAVGFYHIKKYHTGSVSFYTCIKQTIDVLFNTDNSNLMIFSNSMLYHRFIFWFSWGFLLLGLIFLLTPYINKKFQTQEEIERARPLVKKFGQNCSSYLTLEKGKFYYFGKSIEGFVAYGIVRNTAVVLGEPICASKDFEILLTEFKNYCRENAYSILFLNTTGMFIKNYEKLGMGVVKCGEEPRFKLNEYSLAGGNASKVRLNINHATKAGIHIMEYEPLKAKDLKLEKEILAVSKEWFSMKKSSELVFTLGGIDFDNPMDRRYFYAVNSDNCVEGFIVFIPFAGMNGYMADVTRHRMGAVRGVMEKIIYEAMMKFKEEGIEWGSLAVAPLARLEEETEVTARFLNIIYERMNPVYGFKSLYQTKQKYNPTMWEPSYYVYYPAVFTPAMAYAIIKIQNPRGIKDYVMAFIRNIRKCRKTTDKQENLE